MIVVPWPPGIHPQEEEEEQLLLRLSSYSSKNTQKGISERQSNGIRTE